MRRWDGLLDGYMKECETRGLAASTVHTRRGQLEWCGVWLKRRRPKVNLEQIDSDLLIRYLRTRAVFRSKSTVAAAVSTLRGMSATAH
jgi:hypothetical protein